MEHGRKTNRPDGDVVGRQKAGDSGLGRAGQFLIIKVKGRPDERKQGPAGRGCENETDRAGKEAWG